MMLSHACTYVFLSAQNVTFLLLHDRLLMIRILVVLQNAFSIISAVLLLTRLMSTFSWLGILKQVKPGSIIKGTQFLTWHKLFSCMSLSVY